MLYYLMFVMIGYLTGSFLFAPFFGHIIHKRDIISGTKDQNPGTANAFMQGGLWCGILTLVGDMGKGFLPVYFCVKFENTNVLDFLWVVENVLWESRPGWILDMGLAFVLLAPVVGHMFPAYRHFQGGKGIAVTFGCLLGFAPDLFPALTLAFFFILFSVVIRISPHFYRTIGAYLCTASIFFVWGNTMGLKLGFLFITLLLCVRMHMSTEPREQCRVRLLWTH